MSGIILDNLSSNKMHGFEYSGFWTVNTISILVSILTSIHAQNTISSVGKYSVSCTSLQPTQENIKHEIRQRTRSVFNVLYCSYNVQSGVGTGGRLSTLRATSGARRWRSHAYARPRTFRGRGIPRRQPWRKSRAAGGSRASSPDENVRWPTRYAGHHLDWKSSCRRHGRELQKGQYSLRFPRIFPH